MGDTWHGHQDALPGVVLTRCARWVALDPLSLSFTGQGLNAPQGTRVLGAGLDRNRGQLTPSPEPFPEANLSESCRIQGNGSRGH